MRNPDDPLKVGENSSIHLHGIILSSAMDGVPHIAKVGSQRLLFCLAFGLLFVSPIVFSGQQCNAMGAVLTLRQAELIALDEEPGIVSQQWQAKSLAERSVADGQLMDPKLQVGLANLLADSFDFNQENMIQFKVGIIQQFPAGDTLDLKQQKTMKQSELLESRIVDRKLTITKEVRVNYLEIYYWEQARVTIIRNKKFLLNWLISCNPCFQLEETTSRISFGRSWN